MPVTIESPQNPLVKTVSALNQAKVRQETGWILVEGRHPIEEALAAGLVLRHLFCKPEATGHFVGQPVTPVTESVMRKMASTETPPPCMAVFEQPTSKPEVLWVQRPSLLLVLDRLQDPGNVGTILRTAMAFGATGVVTTLETVDVYSPKVIRSSAGLVFSLPLWESGLTLEALWESVIRPRSLPGYCTSGHPEHGDYRQFSYREDCVIILGNEGQGVAPEFFRANAQSITGVRIPMNSKVESLNVSICAGVLLAEVMAQRTQQK